MTKPLNETTSLRDYRAAGGDCMSSPNQRILSRLVEREIVYCVSSLISHFTQNSEAVCGDVSEEDILAICSGQDFETPGLEHVQEMGKDELLDYCNEHDLYADCEAETPFDDSSDTATVRQAVIDHAENDWAQFCNEQNVDAYENEAYEHWAVSSWFMKKLADRGEITGELFDFHIWGRCTTGQAISMDCVIAEIAAEMEILVGQAHTWAE